MKKMLAIIAATAMLGTLVSCGKDTAGSTAESSAAETTTAETSAESSEESSEEESSVSDPLPRDVGPVDENAITFEDGDMHTGHQMGGGGDECDVELSIVDLDGDKKLKVHALREDPAKDYGVVKLVFNLPDMLGPHVLTVVGDVVLPDDGIGGTAHLCAGAVYPLSLRHVLNSRMEMPEHLLDLCRDAYEGIPLCFVASCHVITAPTR